MHNGVTSHLWLKSALHASSHPCMCTCVLRLGCFLLACPVLCFVPPFSFQPFLQREVQVQPLCDFRLGTVVTSDYETPLTEFGIISRTRCCWNSQKADVQFSVQKLQCPGVSSKAKDTENCRYISLRIRQRLRLFFASLFLPISSVFTEQLQTCVKNLNPINMDQGNLMF